MDSTDHNLTVFDDDYVTEYYDEFAGPAQGFLDRGEAAALVAAAGRVRNTPILDIGVGSGRTTALLQLMSSEYTALDYAPNMIDSFRRNFPDLPAHVADARDLSLFGDASFGLVVFSNNGIDTVDHADRPIVLAEFARVLRPDGMVVFSTLNKQGPAFGESPFQLHRPTEKLSLSPQRALTTLGRKALRPGGVVRGVGNWRRGRKRAHDHGSWAVGPLAAHDFGPFMHFTTLPDLRDLVRSAGLQIKAIYREDGSVVGPQTDESTADNFTVLMSR